MKHYTYKPHGVCSRQIDIDLEDGIIKNVAFTGGCSGNTQGVCALIKGMSVDEAIERLRGIHCGPRPTSCPDQLSIALEQAKEA
ncbi:MAG: TIGR03905 family TSCPD domain-containing protein [Clostridia bacterium]|nr:TIGR03905 family TSCPD domain-containing protein [Clostridia bacterium]MBR3686057.1 TIGR03905 family TSCPD domain-containing protein [Clostridia bacterium]MBR4031975.1 TIGR03905 family TSCPD domain-containing protein [Clostridia bacterium]